MRFIAHFILTDVQELMKYLTTYPYYLKDTNFGLIH